MNPAKISAAGFAEHLLVIVVVCVVLQLWRLKYLAAVDYILVSKRNIAAPNHPGRSGSVKPFGPFFDVIGFLTQAG